MNLSIEKERKKTFREAIFERHYFICLHNKCMRQCMTGLRTDGRTYVRTYGHDVITKFSELHGLLPFSLTNGAPQAAFGRWSSAKNGPWLDEFQKANLAREGSWKWNPSCNWLMTGKECGSDVSSRSFWGERCVTAQKTAAKVGGGGCFVRFSYFKYVTCRLALFKRFRSV